MRPLAEQYLVNNFQVLGKVEWISLHAACFKKVLYNLNKISHRRDSLAAKEGRQALPQTFDTEGMTRGRTKGQFNTAHSCCSCRKSYKNSRQRILLLKIYLSKGTKAPGTGDGTHVLIPCHPLQVKFGNFPVSQLARTGLYSVPR